LRPLVRSPSLLSCPPTAVLPGVAFPPVGPLGRGSPPSRPAGWPRRPAGLCSTTTASRPSRPPSLGARGAIPGLLPPFVSRLRLADGWKPPVRARALGHPVPLVFRDIVSRRLLALPRSRVPPLMTCPALRPRWCPGPSPSRPQDGGLPAPASRRLSPPSCSGISLPDHHSTHVGAPSRGLSPCSPSRRASMTGCARRVRS
jgi:hypothetical protein